MIYTSFRFFFSIAKLLVATTKSNSILLNKQKQCIIADGICMCIYFAMKMRNTCLKYENENSYFSCCVFFAGHQQSCFARLHAENLYLMDLFMIIIYFFLSLDFFVRTNKRSIAIYKLCDFQLVCTWRSVHACVNICKAIDQSDAHSAGKKNEKNTHARNNYKTTKKIMLPLLKTKKKRKF